MNTAKQLTPADLLTVEKLEATRKFLIQASSQVREERNEILETINRYQRGIAVLTGQLREKTSTLNANTALYMAKGIEIEKLTGLPAIGFVRINR